MVTINTIIDNFYQVAQNHPQLESFGYGKVYDIGGFDIKYPYLFIINDLPHLVNYSEDNSNYSHIDYTFTIRVGDKVNNQPNIYNAIGQDSNNGLEIISDTMQILLDIINDISTNVGLWSEVKIVDSLSVEPFFNEDVGDVNGHQVDVVLRVKNENQCDTPLTRS